MGLILIWVMSSYVLYRMNVRMSLSPTVSHTHTYTHVHTRTHLGGSVQDSAVLGVCGEAHGHLCVAEQGEVAPQLVIHITVHTLERQTGRQADNQSMYYYYYLKCGLTIEMVSEHFWIITLIH